MLIFFDMIALQKSYAKPKSSIQSSKEEPRLPTDVKFTHSSSPPVASIGMENPTHPRAAAVRSRYGSSTKTSPEKQYSAYLKKDVAKGKYTDP